MKALLLVLDLAGTFVFALSGATAGVRQRLDLFGVLVVSFVAGNFGGITRDLMIGAVPPAAIGSRSATPAPSRAPLSTSPRRVRT